MRHHLHKQNFNFVKEPMEFSKDTPLEQLRYCIGGLLYMPATKDFKEALLNQKYKSLTSMVMDFEDAANESNLSDAQNNAASFLQFVREATEKGDLSSKNTPLIFFRVRSMKQYEELINVLGEENIKYLTGFIFPKTCRSNAIQYLSRLQRLNNELGTHLYAMPIIEGKEVAYKESRFDELIGLKAIFDCYKDLILNVRVGGTDFSACFGVRRGIDYTIYDIMPVRDCLLDIINVFGRDLDYVISGPVWEYFLTNKNMKFENIDEVKFSHSLLTRHKIVNSAVDGLLRELVYDKANGFVGKTTIHPTHLPFVNGMQAVIRDEYEDAVQILNTSDGVIKSKKGNKMNEIKPHTNWAKKVVARAEVFGVIENEDEYLKLFIESTN